MGKRPPLVKRTVQSLTPTVGVLVVSGARLETLSPSDVAAERVGQKAVGLTCLPRAWTAPFFVVSACGAPPDSGALSRAALQSKFAPGSKLLVRSSGVAEDVEARGAFDSVECPFERLGQVLAELSACGECGSLHWVVQESLEQRAKGHLSNERRVAKDKRDWVAEFEASTVKTAESHRIPLRQWRDSRLPAEARLECAHRELIIERLRTVARWTYDRLIRVHFEWVWDGNAVFIVQADPCDDVPQGVDPHDLITRGQPVTVDVHKLSAFRRATQADFDQYKKLANVKLYSQLGYDPVPFYVLDSEADLRQVLKSRACSALLRHDLNALTGAALVIRTDGTGIPRHLREMLPRSDELRSTEAAERWLVGDFADKVTAVSESGERLSDYRLCLIAHHFVPAVASAWCQALPDQRRVRIESLWGIPEGLYWYAYDVFDVDTIEPSAHEVGERPAALSIRSRERYKEHFVGPDANGSWVVLRTNARADWARSIRRTEWIQEIAWTSRCIATRENRPVVVMWLIDTCTTSTRHRVLPWYHQDWKHEGPIYKASPRKKLARSSDVVVRTRGEWLALKYEIESGRPVARIRVDPREHEMVRDQAFVGDLATVAKRHSTVIELNGGVLSHAYYMLSRAGCDVECADLDDFAVDAETIEFNKLVRDEIPRVIVERGETVAVMRLKGEALVAALKRKLVEEALETLDAKSTDEIAEELADLREVAAALMAELELSDTRVEAARREKLRKRGGFAAGLMLGRTAVSPSIGGASHGESPLVAGAAVAEKTLTTAAELPRGRLEDIHVDFRRDIDGTAERQLTFMVPTHVAGFEPPRVSFDLNTPGGESHEMSCELQVERKGADVRLRIRLINAPQQLTLDLGKAQ